MLAGMSTDYYSRLEQQRGPHPSESMLAAIAQALHLGLDERDHLFRLAGQNTPDRKGRDDHVSPGMMRILDRLRDTPAMVVNGAGETLMQTPMAVALVGDELSLTGLRRSIAYRWFTEETTRARFLPEDHDLHSRAHTSRLRAAATRDGQGSRAAEIAEALMTRSEEFSRLWLRHDVATALTDTEKRILHPELGVIEVQCQLLQDPASAHSLLVYTAVPGTDSHEKLALLSAVAQ